MSDKQLLLNENKVSNCGQYYEYGSNWRTKWMRLLRRPEIFLINFSIVAIFQGSIFTYVIGCLSTLEKRYSFDSKVSGFILIADNISQIFISPLVGHLGNKHNRPRIMAIGEMIAASSCFVFAAPYFIYGSSILPASSSNLITNTTNTHELCSLFHITENCDQSTVWLAVAILWIGNFLNGIGCTAFYTIGIPYIDDNTSKKNSPIFLSTTAAVRMFGPALGLLLSSYTLKYYENPLFELDVPMNGPRWIGCWWLGFIIIGILLFIFSIPLAFFPTQMSEKQRIYNKKYNDNSTIKSQLAEIISAFKRLVTNPIFMLHVMGITFKLIGYLGYYIFKPKYIESQFGKSASDANFWTGVITIPTMAFGIIAGGFVLSRLKPRARNVAIYVFFIEVIIAISILYAKTFQCPIPIFPQTDAITGNLQMTSPCNSNCHCTDHIFQPVCSSNGQFNYFSPCHAGCTQQTFTDNHSKNKIYSNCKCDQFGGQVTDGYCHKNCDQFSSYIILFAIIGVITSTGKIGDTLITLRCIDPHDKNFAIGVTGAFFAIFAFIPYPLIFGAVTDSACKIWKSSCGKVGNCRLYDTHKLADYLHYSAFAFILIGAFCRLFIVLYANRISNMFEDEDQPEDLMKTRRSSLKVDDHNYKDNFEDVLFKQN